jgi:hypothetical protein
LRMGSWERLPDYADLQVEKQVNFFFHLPAA